MATKKGKARTAAANAARRKQGPTKRTDYKNGKAVSKAAKKNSGGGGSKGRSSGSGSGSSTGPGSSGKSKSAYMKKDAAARSKRLDKEISGLQREKRMTRGNRTQQASLAQKISQKSQQKRLNDDIASGKRDSTGKRIGARKTSTAKTAARKKVTIDSASSAMKSKGLELGRPTTNLKTGKTTYKVTNKKTGKTVSMSTSAIKKIAIP